MFCASRTRDAHAAAVVVRYVVLADWLFTTTTIIVQPLTGLFLVRLAGFPLNSRWIVWSFVLYFIAGGCWLPVVWIQIRMRRLAEAAARSNAALPETYWQLFRWWVTLGIPAFIALVIVFWLMIAKPV